MDKHIALYQETRLKENAKATELIKSMLIDFKDQNISFNYALNNIVEHLNNIENEHITNRPEIFFLLSVFEKGKGNFESGMLLLVIPNILKQQFDKIEDLDISFDDYVTHLAERRSLSRARVKLQSNYKLYEAMYKIGKLDGYDHLPKFDVRMFQYEPNYEKLEEEIFGLAYPQAAIKSKSDKEVPKDTECRNEDLLNGNNLFIFRSHYNVIMQNENIFEIIKDNYFHPNTNYEDYQNVFFKNPEEHSSKIYLKCKNQTFSKLLDEFKNTITYSISFINIEKSQLFITKLHQKPLRRVNISNSLTKATNLDKDTAYVVINAVRNFPKKLLKTHK